MNNIFFNHINNAIRSLEEALSLRLHLIQKAEVQQSKSSWKLGGPIFFKI